MALTFFYISYDMTVLPLLTFLEVFMWVKTTPSKENFGDRPILIKRSVTIHTQNSKFGFSI